LRILVIDNYDSFTYNLVHMLCYPEIEVMVFRNDKISPYEAEELSPHAIIISPGPCTPKEAGICVDLIRYFKEKLPILGVCLGHQCLAFAFGAEVGPAKRIMHGKVSKIFHKGDAILKKIPSPFEACRYHSLAVFKETLSNEFEIIAEDEIGEIMGIAHRSLPLFGLQFHPEAVLTQYGQKIMDNFLKIVRRHL